MISNIVRELQKLGPLPSESCSDITLIAKYQKLIGELLEPVSNEDASELVQLFGDDDCFGLAWTLLHRIESAPGWPLEESLNATGNGWVGLLRRRSQMPESNELQSNELTD